MDNKKLLIKEAKEDIIWQKLKLLAKELGFGSYDCKLVVHDSRIIEVDVVRELNKIRAD